ncbi:MAG: YciI family protein [Pseudomonadota bacterium]
MKHFIVEATYLVPFEQIAETIPRHRAFLQKGYDLGLFLCSGPKAPPTGGFLVARAKSKAELEAFFENEPFQVAGLASFTFTEFQPVKRQDWTEHWFGGAEAPASQAQC